MPSFRKESWPQSCFVIVYIGLAVTLSSSKILLLFAAAKVVKQLKKKFSCLSQRMFPKLGSNIAGYFLKESARCYIFEILIYLKYRMICIMPWVDNDTNQCWESKLHKRILSTNELEPFGVSTNYGAVPKANTWEKACGIRQSYWSTNRSTVTMQNFSCVLPETIIFLNLNQAIF